MLAVVALLVTFLAGAVVGAAADRILLIHRGGAAMPPHAATMMLNRLDRRLDLTDTQRAQVGEILNRRHARMNALWTAVRPRVQQEIAAANDEITRLLTPEQRKKFEELKLRMHGPRHGKHRRRL
jgi:Spy/CpxP family protein refolding chaperone